MTENGQKVTLYVYDLSQGMARVLSRNLTGRQIDGIWHTSVVAFGREYWFGQGIFSSSPGHTHYGRPVEMVDMGETYIPRDVFVDYIESLRSIFTAERYHLLNHNCNNFTNEVCQFLTGKTIPSHITGLPQDFLETPFGQALRPMIEGFFDSSPARALPTPTPAIAPSTPLQTSALPTKPHIQSITSLAQLQSLIQTSRAVVVDFTSQTCGPCVAIKPEFDRLIQTYGFRKRKQLLTAVKVEMGMAFEISSYYKVSATPTFMFFVNGEKIDEFKGANRVQLESSIKRVMSMAYPPHPHAKIPLPTLTSLCLHPILFDAASNVDQIFVKLQSVMSESNVKLSNDELACLENLKIFIRKTVQKETAGRVPNGWNDFIHRLLLTIPLSKAFPVVDILRLLILQPEVADFYTKDSGNSMLNFIRSVCESPDVPKATLLMTLRAACNMFSLYSSASHLLSHNSFSNSTSTVPAPPSTTSPSLTHRSITSAFLILCLLHSDSNVRKTASSLGFNVSIWHMKRVIEGGEEVTFLVGGWKDGMNGQSPEPEDEDDEEWLVEMVSAVVGALEKEEDIDIVYRLLATTANFMYQSPSTIIELVSVLGLQNTMNEKLKLFSQNEKAMEEAKRTAFDNVKGLIKEVNLLIEAPS